MAIDKTELQVSTNVAKDAIYCLMASRVRDIIEQATKRLNYPDTEGAVDRIIRGADELRDIRLEYARLNEVSTESRKP